MEPSFIKALRKNFVTWASEQDGSVDVDSVNLKYDNRDERVHISVSIQGSPIQFSVVVAQQHVDTLNDDDSQRASLWQLIVNTLLYAASAAFYRDNYDLIFDHGFETTEVRLLPGGPDGCRYCGKREPDVSFAMKAHALPEAAGNTHLLSSDECDDCNQFFGRGIENEFANFTNAARTIGQVEGKNGIPTLLTRNGELAVSDGTTTIKVFNHDLIFLGDNPNELIVKLQRPSYIPISVLKCFHKMAVGVMPAEELSKFKTIIEWLRTASSAPLPVGVKSTILEAHCISSKFQSGGCFLWQRKNANSTLPYMTFVLCFADFAYQLAITGADQLDVKELSFTPFAWMLCSSPELQSGIYTRNYDSVERRKGDEVEFSLFVPGGVRADVAAAIESKNWALLQTHLTH